MKKLLKLYKMMNKNNSSKEGSNAVMGANTFIMLVIGTFVALGAGILSCKYAQMISMLGGITTVLLIVGFIATVLIFGLGVMTLINSMYMSSDIEVLITMPFSGTQIAILRVLSFFSLALAATMVAILAPCIGYSIAMPLDILTWILIVLTGFLVPVFAVSMTSIVIILVMSFLKIFRNREVLKFIGACVMFVLMCIYFFFSSDNSAVNMENAFASLARLIKLVQYTNPVVAFICNYINSGNILDLLISISCVGISVVLFIFVTKTFYLKGALNMQDAGSGKILSDAELEKRSKQKNVMNALITKEYRMVRRNSVYLLHNFFMGALWPIAVVLMFKQALPSIIEMINNSQNVNFGGFNMEVFMLVETALTLIVLFIITIPLMMQTLAYTSISREGNSFSIMKQLPISYEIQLEAKRRMASYVAQASVTGYTLLIFIGISILLHVPIYYFVLPLIIVYLVTEMNVNLNMYMGIQKADVSWDNEKDIIDKPVLLVLCGLSPMIVTLIFAVVMFGLGLVNMTIAFGTIVVIGIMLFVGSTLLKKRIMVEGEKKIRRLRF